MYVAIFMGPGPGIAPADEHAVIDLCIEQSIACAEAGFSLVTFGEQHFNGYEPYCNPFMMGARVAPHMKDTYLGTTVCPLPFHHPLRLAEQINVLDVMTKGKTIIGLSAGRPSSGPGMPSDFDSFALDPADRDSLFDTKLDVMLKAWAHRREDEPMVVDTPWDKGLLRGQLMPMAYREGRPLLAIGANSEASIKRAAALRFPLFLGPCPPMEAVTKMATYVGELERLGATTDEIEQLRSLSLIARVVIVGESEDAAWALAEKQFGHMVPRRGDPRSLRELSRIPLDTPDIKNDPLFPGIRFVHSGLTVGTPDQVAEGMLFYAANGIPQVHTRFPVTSPYDPQSVWPSFDLFVKEVMPKLDPQTFPAPARAEASAVRPGGGVPIQRSAG